VAVPAAAVHPAPEPAPAAPPASASAPAASEAASAGPKIGEEIVVTGSRIRRKELSTPAPVVVIGREQIQSSGLMSVGDFLQAIPEQGNATNTSVNNGGDGSTNISLRGLGAERTLVLIDGKRFIGGVPGGGSLYDPGVDLNSIPSAAIERIEILKDGASAVYGSDAIGGVVNIITRKHFNAVEATASRSISQHGDSGVTDISVLGGAASEKGSFSFGAGYYQQDSLFAASRDWAKYAKTYDYMTGQEYDGGSSAIPQGRVSIDPSKCSTQLCKDLLAAYGPGVKNFMPDSSTPDEIKLPLVDGWRRYSSADAYNFQAVNFLITPSDRTSLFANGDYFLGGGARAYFHSTFVHRRSSTMLAPVPIFTSNFGLVLSGANEHNPFGVDITDVRRRFVEGGGRSQAQSISTMHVITGIDGSLPDSFGVLSKWIYDVSFTYARNDSTVTTNGSLNTQLVGQGLGPSKDGVCYSDTSYATPIAGCTPVDLFGGTMDSAMANTLGAFTGINHGFNQSSIVDANLSGDLFKLAAERAIALAIGYEYRNEYGFYTYNPIAIAGNDSDYAGNDTSGRYHVHEGYAELRIPVIEKVPGAESLDLEAALRLSNFSSFGGASTYKVGLRYSPIRDVTLRGTVSTGYRAPGISSLYGGTGPNAESATDPCGGAATPALAEQCAAELKRGGGGTAAVANGDDITQVMSTSGGNPDLKPEKANVYTFGVVVEPRSLIKNFSITADLYGIDISDTIDYITTPVILAGCYPGEGKTPNQAYCDLIQRGSDGRIIDVKDVLQNVGKLSTTGLDLSLRYRIPTTFGRFTLSGDSSFLFKMNKTLADGTLVKGLNNYDLGVYPTLKLNLGVAYNIGGFLASVRGRLVGSYHECADATQGGISSGSGLCYLNPTVDGTAAYPTHQVPAYMTLDLHLAYALKLSGNTLTVAAGMRNLFNTDPPRVYNSSGQTNSDPTTYDYVGRTVYGQLRIAL
jgi:iron complex outermembrane receptor protein